MQSSSLLLIAKQGYCVPWHATRCPNHHGNGTVCQSAQCGVGSGLLVEDL
jgi:hypothetical protein